MIELVGEAVLLVAETLNDSNSSQRNVGDSNDAWNSSELELLHILTIVITQ